MVGSDSVGGQRRRREEYIVEKQAVQVNYGIDCQLSCYEKNIRHSFITNIFNR